MHLDNQRLFQEFTNKDINQSTSSSIYSRQYSKRILIFTTCLSDNQPNDPNS